MQANQRKTMEIARTELNQILTNLAQQEVQKILKTVNNKLGNHNNEQRQIYASMEPIDIINDLIEICRKLCQSKKMYFHIRNFMNILFRLFIISKNISCTSNNYKRSNVKKYISNRYLSWSFDIT